MSIWLWNWHNNKFINKMEEGVVLYKKPFRNINQMNIKKTKLNRRLETKRVRTHDKK